MYITRSYYFIGRANELTVFPLANHCAAKKEEKKSIGSIFNIDPHYKRHNYESFDKTPSMAHKFC